jgi:carboxypeptidase C (cathepsin A)
MNRADGKIASLYDSAVKALDPDPTAANPHYRDPFLAGLKAPMTSAMLGLYAAKLDWRTERQYLKSNGEANRNWKWGNSPSPPESVGDLKGLLALDARLRVLVTHGFTDLVTPYFATELVLDQLPAYGDPGRVTSLVYPGGHMFYSRDGSRAAFREDALKMLRPLLGEAPPAQPAP